MKKKTYGAVESGGGRGGRRGKKRSADFFHFSIFSLTTLECFKGYLISSAGKRLQPAATPSADAMMVASPKR